MNPTCKRIRDRLATDGPQALSGDDAGQQHLAECNECFAFLESLSAIENGLHEMAGLDAPDHVVETLLARPELVQPAGATVAVRKDRSRFTAFLSGLLRPRPLVWSSLATGILLFAFVIGGRLKTTHSPTESFAVVQQRAAEESVETEPNDQQLDKLKSLGYGHVADAKDDDIGDEVARKAKKPLPPAMKSKVGAKIEPKNEALPHTEESEPTAPADPSTRFSDDFIADIPVPGRYYQANVTPPSAAQEAEKAGEDRDGIGSRDSSAADAPQEQAAGNPNSIEELESITEGAAAEFGKENARSRWKPVGGSVAGPRLAGTAGVSTPMLVEASRVAPVYPEAARAAGIESQVVLQVIVRADGTVDAAEVLEAGHANLGFEQAALDAVRQWRYEPATLDGRPVDVFFTVVVKFDLRGENSSIRPLTTDPGVRAVGAFLDERRSLDDLSFKPATGYWSTSYVPGDPALRLLQSRLRGWDRSSLTTYLPSKPELHDASRQVGQPFDAPGGSALAVYLHADQRGISDRGRVLLQVGLRGTERHGGRRPAMNLGIVLDLRNTISQSVAIGLRSLIDAFNQAKEPGDRFRLFVAGRSDDLVVDADEFRHGFLKVTLDRLLAESRPACTEDEILDAVSAAVQSVAGADDPDTPLGSSAVIVITADALGSATDPLARLAHRSAVVGVPLSMIGVGSEVDLAEIDRVILAGQGSRRLLQRPADAADLVDRELSAASRAVARAVRLRIRLAPGVQLIDVLGSERLDEQRAQRVRDAERSIDLRLSRNLGIQADRGEDEEGIQIVIPSFYASDSHVVLLDVVAPGPGPLADVTVRYKDLVHLRNAVGRSSLALDRNTRPIGPLERNVLKNLLSFRLARTLDEAGRILAAGDATAAAEMLGRFQTLLEGLRHEVPGLDHDAETIQDIAMLHEYRTLVASDLTTHSTQRDLLSDSLRYAARLKLQSLPMET